MNRKNQRGYALLLTAVIIVLGISITALITAKSLYFDQKELNNERNQALAFQAAEAGLEFGISYLYDNKSAITADTDLNGFIDGYTNAAITNVAFSNGTTFNVVYSNPVVNNFSTLQISSTGTSDNGSTTRTITQLLQIFPIVTGAPPASVIAKGNVALSGNLTVANTIVNTSTNNTIWSGGTVALTGSAETIANGGIGSDKNGINSDVVHDDAGLSSLTSEQFFSGFFGDTKANASTHADIVLNNSSNYNMSATLNGVTGKSIWVNQTGGEASFSGNATIGSAAHPVVLVINGPFKANGTTVIYGMVYIAGDWDNGGGGDLTVNGGIVVEGTLTSTGTPNVNYSPTVMQNLNGIGDYVKVPGSWRDF